MKPARIQSDLSLPAVIWDGMSFEEWRAQAPKLGRLARGLQFLIAAWVLHGEARYGERYAQAVAETGLAEQTILNILSVARAFPESRRRENLSFAHHEAVCGLNEGDQDRWLSWAEQEGHSVTRLRAAIRSTRPHTPRPLPDPDELPPPPHLIVGSLVQIGEQGLCKVVGIYKDNPTQNHVMLHCVRL